MRPYPRAFGKYTTLIRSPPTSPARLTPVAALSMRAREKSALLDTADADDDVERMRYPPALHLCMSTAASGFSLVLPGYRPDRSDQSLLKTLRLLNWLRIAHQHLDYRFVPLSYCSTVPRIKASVTNPSRHPHHAPPQVHSKTATSGVLSCTDGKLPRDAQGVRPVRFAASKQRNPSPCHVRLAIRMDDQIVWLCFSPAAGTDEQVL